MEANSRVKGTFISDSSHDLMRFGSHCGIAPDGARLPGYFDGPISTGHDAHNALVEEKVPCDDGELEEGVVVGG